jgi:hypothetical protein
MNFSFYFLLQAQDVLGLPLARRLGLSAAWHLQQLMPRTLCAPILLLYFACLRGWRNPWSPERNMDRYIRCLGEMFHW